MPLPTWLTLRRRTHAPDAWVGAQRQQQHWLLAHVRSGRRGTRPRVEACHLGPSGAGLPALQGWWEQHAGRRGNATLLLSGNEYQILPMDAPAVEATEYRDATRWQIRDLIDFPVENAALDCLRLPGASAGSAPAKLITVVTRQALVQDAVKHWRNAGMKLTAIDIPEMALRNLAVLAAGASASAFIHVGLESAHLILLWQEELCMSRQLAIGADALRTQDASNRDALIERLALEIQRTIDAFGRQFSTANLERLWVSSVHDAPALAQSLALQLSLPVQAYLPEDWLEFSADATACDLDARVDHLLAIGAALRGEASA